MHWLGRIALASSLVSLVASCGTSEDKPAARFDRSAAPGGQACAQQVAELGNYLDELDKARAALAADPLAARTGAILSPSNALSVTDAALITPVPDGVTIEIGKENIVVAGAPLSPADLRDPAKAFALNERFGTAICPDADQPVLHDVIAVVHPDALWNTVKQVILYADAAGAARIFLAFATPAGIAVPTAPELAAVADLDPQAALAACPALTEAMTQAGQTTGQTAGQTTGRADHRSEAITTALTSCQCAVSPATIRALAYRQSGLAERDGHVPAAIELSFVDPEAKPESERTVISAAEDAPWSEAHRTVLTALERRGAFVAAVQGKSLPARLLAVPDDRTIGHCQGKRAKARLLDKARREGVLGALEQSRGGAFIKLPDGRYKSRINDTNVKNGLLGDLGDELGQGGTGWNTIEPGTYNPLGNARFGIKANKEASRSQIRLGTAVVTGPLDKNIIRRYIRRKLPRLQKCYETQLLVTPDIKGTVTVNFQIAGDGKVTNASASGVHAQVSECVAGIVQTIQFYKPKNGGTVSVRYPFKFKSTGK